MDSAKTAFIGIPRIAIDATDEGLRAAVAPIRAKVNGRFSRGELSGDVQARAPGGLI